MMALFHSFLHLTNIFEHLLYARHCFRVLAVDKDDTTAVLNKQVDSEQNLIAVSTMKKKNPG